jgi:hypothetical protein
MHKGGPVRLLTLRDRSFLKHLLRQSLFTVVI